MERKLYLIGPLQVKHYVSPRAEGGAAPWIELWDRLLLSYHEE